MFTKMSMLLPTQCKWYVILRRHPFINSSSWIKLHITNQGKLLGYLYRSTFDECSSFENAQLMVLLLFSTFIQRFMLSLCRKLICNRHHNKLYIIWDWINSLATLCTTHYLLRPTPLCHQFRKHWISVNTNNKHRKFYTHLDYWILD